MAMGESEPERRRLYQVWKGSNKFLCGGRLIFGPDAGSLSLSTVLISSPLIGLCFQCVTKVACPRRHHPSWPSGSGVPVPDVEPGPRDRATERAPAGVRRRGRRSRRRRCRPRRHAVHRVGDKRGEPAPPAAAHEGRGRCRRARRPGEVLRHVPAVPAAPGVALLHLQQLRPEVRPPLPLGWPVHWPAQLPVLLPLHLDVDVPVPVRLRAVLAEHRRAEGQPRRVAAQVHDRRAAVPRAHRLHLRLSVVRRRPHRVPRLPHEHKPDDVRELQVPVRQEGEPVRPGRGGQHLRGVLHRDAAVDEQVPGMGGSATAATAGGVRRRATLFEEQDRPRRPEREQDRPGNGAPQGRRRRSGDPARAPVRGDGEGRCQRARQGPAVRGGAGPVRDPGGAGAAARRRS